MENVLTPAIGSNQHKTIFNSKAKKKARVTWKIKAVAALIILLAASVASNVYLLKTNYVINCDVTIGNIVQNHAGHFMNNRRCDQINQDWMEARNYEAKTYSNQ